MEKEKYVIKECKHHGLTKYIYVPSANRYKCSKCQSEAVQKRRDKIKQILVEYKGGQCEICGYDKCIQALEFHHIDPTQKDFGIGTKGYTRSIEENKKEVDKCILVCANCHREIHENVHKNNIQNEEKIANHSQWVSSKKISSLNKEQIQSLIKDGYKQQNIAIKLNVSLATLKRFLKDNNMKQKNNYLINEN